MGSLHLCFNCVMIRRTEFFPNWVIDCGSENHMRGRFEVKKKKKYCTFRRISGREWVPDVSENRTPLCGCRGKQRSVWIGSAGLWSGIRVGEKNETSGSVPLCIHNLNRDISTKKLFNHTHCKNARDNVARKRVNWGRIQFRVKLFSFLQTWQNEVRATQLWIIFWGKLIKFWVIVDPELSLTSPGYTLKTPGSAVTPEKGPLGPNSIPGQRWPGNQSNWLIMGSDWPSSGSYFASSWLISESSLTRNGVWTPMDPFQGHADPGVFRVYVTLTRAFLGCM